MVSSNTRDAQRTWYPPTQETRKEHGIPQKRDRQRTRYSPIKKYSYLRPVLRTSCVIHVPVPQNHKCHFNFSDTISRF